MKHLRKMLCSNSALASFGAQLLLKTIRLALDMHKAHESGPRDERAP